MITMYFVYHKSAHAIFLRSPRTGRWLYVVQGSDSDFLNSAENIREFSAEHSPTNHEILLASIKLSIEQVIKYNSGAFITNWDEDLQKFWDNLKI